MKKRNAVLSITAILALGLSPHIARPQGSLTPPGPPAPTMKTLDEVEPRIPLPGGTNTVSINSPGSYYLTGGVTVPPGDGIRITSPDVTLDLNGFIVEANHGVLITATNGNIVIRNGTIRGTGFVQTGIEATGVRQLAVVDVRFVACRTGILAGDLFRGENLSFTDHNGREGVSAGDNSVVRGLQMRGGRSFSPVILGGGALVESCVISGLTNSTSASFTTAIQVGPASLVRHCAVSDCNVGSNTFVGVSTANAGRVEHCTVSANSSASSCRGISVNSGTVIEQCNVSLNSGDGLRTWFSCRVANNLCTGNGGAGILVPAGAVDCRVESNNATDNARGLDIDGTGNLIIRNSASGNGINYDIAADNKVGVIVSAPNSLAISGSTGGAGVGTTDPWANLSF